jgi:hypothetical protein
MSVCSGVAVWESRPQTISAKNYLPQTILDITNRITYGY